MLQDRGLFPLIVRTLKPAKNPVAHLAAKEFDRFATKPRVGLTGLKRKAIGYEEYSELYDRYKDKVDEDQLNKILREAINYSISYHVTVGMLENNRKNEKSE
ncbi:MAG: hypothetical protein ABIJ34_02295 [archaeon]